eukprot:scaffold26939_cov20-Tisochrysis_lutea.AAC.1
MAGCIDLHVCQHCVRLRVPGRDRVYQRLDVLTSAYDSTACVSGFLESERQGASGVTCRIPEERETRYSMQSLPSEIYLGLYSIIHASAGSAMSAGTTQVARSTGTTQIARRTGNTHITRNAVIPRTVRKEVIKAFTAEQLGSISFKP